MLRQSDQVTNGRISCPPAFEAKALFTALPPFVSGHLKLYTTRPAISPAGNKLIRLIDTASYFPL